MKALGAFETPGIVSSTYSFTTRRYKFPGIMSYSSMLLLLSIVSRMSL
jgi:hypothetical protein